MPLVDRMVRVDLRTVTLDGPAAGGDHARQRARPGGRGLLLPRRRPGRGDHRDRGLRARHVADRPDHAAVGAGRADLDQLLAERDRLNEDLQKIIDEQTEPWGIKVSTVEIKDVEIPEAMQRAMARQAEAERERRAKVINAEGEFQAAEKLAGAAEIIGREPSARCSCATSRRCSRWARTRTRRSCSRCRSTCSSRSWRGSALRRPAQRPPLA